MPSISTTQAAFLAFNAALGLLVGWLSATNAAFEQLGIPSYAWLIAGMFAYEVLAGFVLMAHPSAIITMPMRVAGLVIAFLTCYGTLGALRPA